MQCARVRAPLLCDQGRRVDNFIFSLPIFPIHSPAVSLHHHFISSPTRSHIRTHHLSQPRGGLWNNMNNLNPQAVFTTISDAINQLTGCCLPNPTLYINRRSFKVVKLLGEG